jgi:hypothetical protein
MQQLNRGRTRIYNGSNIGGIAGRHNVVAVIAVGWDRK